MDYKIRDEVYIDLSVYTGEQEGRDGIIVYPPFYNKCEGWWESTIKSEGIKKLYTF